MDYGVSNILLEEAKKKNKSALNSILRSRVALKRMKVFGIFNSNFRSQYDVIENVLEEANRSIKALKRDKSTLDYLSRISFDYEFDDNYLELINVIGVKDEEMLIRFCKMFESTLFIRRGIRYVPKVPKDVSEERDKIIDDKMRLVRELSSKA